jgi:thiamine kinase-like enzyme
MSSRARDRTVEANSVVEQLSRATGQSYLLVGRMTGGETGAFEVIDGDGRRMVMKWNTEPAVWATLTLATELTDRLRTEARWPVPSQQILRVGDPGEPCQVVLQELMSGHPAVGLTHGLIDRLLDLHHARRGLGRSADPDSWADRLRRTLVDGGNGYCLHEPLRTYDRRTRALLDRVQAIGRALRAEDVAGRDIVHWDLHPGNLLVMDGEVTAIIDTEWATVGDAAFDLVTLALSARDHPCAPGVVGRLWRTAIEATDEPRRAVYVAHLSLRFVDWSIRHHSASDVDRWLDEADRRLPP